MQLGIEATQQVGNRRKGKIHCYSGTGKGKSTAAMGVALRSLGSSDKTKVAIAQFLKGGDLYDEDPAIAALGAWEERIWYQRSGTGRHLLPNNISDREIAEAKTLWNKAKQAIESGEFNLVVLDEINPVTTLGLISTTEVVRSLERRPSHTEVVLTGTNPPSSLLRLADLHSLFNMEVGNHSIAGVSIHTGGGKGKSTAAMGKALCEIGKGNRVSLIRWLKGGYGYSEDSAIAVLESRYPSLFHHYRCGKEGKIVWMGDQTREHYIQAEKGWLFLQEELKHGCQQIILDEIVPAVELGLVDEDLLKFFLENCKPNRTEILLAGRQSCWKRYFDLASEIVFTLPEKHYNLTKKGIDF